MSNVKRLAPTLFVCSMLISCASGTPRTEVQLIKVPLTIEQEWAQVCSDLPELEGFNLSDALKNHVEVANLYHRCKAKHNELRRAIEGHNGGI